MQTDKKIEDYLKRAEKIAEKNYNVIFSENIIEIAKMIQLEEHREPDIDYNLQNL